MAKTLGSIIDHVKNIHDQIKADAASFLKLAEIKRRESYINARIKELEINYSEAKTQHLKIIASKEENSLREKYFNDEVFIKLKETYFDYYGELTEALTEEAGGAANTSTHQDKGEELRLKRIELPPFAGGYENWRPFYELYMSLVHTNDSLADIQKLHYLKTTVQGEAARLLQHVTLEKKNYNSAWTLLTDRYENKRVLVNTHLRTLTNLKPLIIETAFGIKRIFDTTNECIHSLRNLGILVDSWDTILIHLLITKLPPHTQELWENELQGARNLIEFCTFSKFLETRFRTMEAIEQSKQEASKSYKPSHQIKPFSKPTKSLHTGLAQGYQPTLSSRSCYVCDGKHNLNHCEKFINMTIQMRKQTVEKASACRNCLSYHHHERDCTSKFLCRYCNKRHHTMLHATGQRNGNIKPQTPRAKPQPFFGRSTRTQHLVFNTDSKPNPSINNRATPIGHRQAQTQRRTEGNGSINNDQEIQTLFTQQAQSTKVLLATALVRCRPSYGGSITLLALIDPGSEATFITEDAVQKLKLSKRKANTTIISLGQLSTGTSYGQVNVTMSSIYNTKFTLAANCLVYKKITSILPSEPVEFHQWKHLEGIELADPNFCKPRHIDLLLGADVYATIILPGLLKGSPGEPIAQQTELGWLISGHIADANRKTIHTHHQLVSLDDQLRRFWEIEGVPVGRQQTEEEKMCEKHFIETHTRRPDGKYEVSLPFKNNIRPIFEGSRQIALSRLYQLESRCRVNPKLKNLYDECLEDYISSAHMVETHQTSENESYYLPHHAVFKESSTTKLRVVFDASCKTKSGRSLNESLMIGPTLQNEITHTITKWRKFKYAYTADIAKMYRQIWINPEDSRYQLICWRQNTTSAIKTYALQTVTFGTAAAPYLAIRTLLQLASDEEQNFPVAAKILRGNIYVDDIMCGADSLEEAAEAQRQLIGITNSAGFPLRKWASNEETLLQNVPEEYREIEIPLTMGGDKYVKTLGFQWHPGKDIFRFKFNLPKLRQITKRTILADISRLFDPHGWISPCIVHAKLIIQELWLQHAGWDDDIPESLEKTWIRYRDELTTLETIEIPRWIHTSNNGDNIQLHGFCDASERAYAAVIYIRVKSSNAINVQLVTAKTKIAPIKRISIPRLELCAAALLAKLINITKNVMDLQTVDTYAWTDSTITLAWIKAHPSKWKTFVANRVSEIQSTTATGIWRHINTKDNPADIASRGLFPSKMEKATMWWAGPPMLHEERNSYQDTPHNIQLDTDLERKLVRALTIQTSSQFILAIIQKFSTSTRAIRVIAYCIRAVKNFIHTQRRNINPLSLEETEDALLLIIQAVQAATFSAEINKLKAHTGINRQSKILALSPFLDEKDILRVGGRLHHTTMPFERKHPIILPYNHHFTNLIIRDAHLKTLHGGLTATATFIHQNYLILRAKRNIRKITASCVKCFRYKAQPATQRMGDLPQARVQMARPFYNSGIDYAGPIDIKAWKGRCNKMHKGYIAIFICLCTKAIHIELVSDLSTEAFMAAYRRFTARRGICRNLYSDQGTNFIGAISNMKTEMNILKTQWEKDILNTLTTIGTQWHLNPPASLHFGGLWEAGVKSVKHHLKRTVGTARLTFEEYATLLSQIEACLNSRPLCPKTQDPDDLSTLTPGHFLIMETLNTTPERDVLNKNVNTLDRWRYIQRLYQMFWHKWSTEYLSRLQQRPKWLTQQPNLKIGDMVIIKDNRQPPTHWQMARILGIHPGEDKLVRVVTLKTATTTLKRPIHKLCLLPIDDNGPQQ